MLRELYPIKTPFFENFWWRHCRWVVVWAHPNQKSWLRLWYEGNFSIPRHRLKSCAFKELLREILFPGTQTEEKAMSLSSPESANLSVSSKRENQKNIFLYCKFDFRFCGFANFGLSQMANILLAGSRWRPKKKVLITPTKAIAFARTTARLLELLDFTVESTHTSFQVEKWVLWNTPGLHGSLYSYPFGDPWIQKKKATNFLKSLFFF